MASRFGDINLTKYDDLFTTDESRAEAQQERVQEIALSELHPFEGHPFRVVDDEEMMKTVESVREFGVLTPAIVRPAPDGGYEIISGHRRHRASELAGEEDFEDILWRWEVDWIFAPTYDIAEKSRCNEAGACNNCALRDKCGHFFRN